MSNKHATGSKCQGLTAHVVHSSKLRHEMTNPKPVAPNPPGQRHQHDKTAISDAAASNQLAVTEAQCSR